MAIEYEDKMREMLELVSDDVDKREGSIIQTTLAPVAFHLSMEETMLSWLMQNLYLDTAEDEFLDRVLYLTGIKRRLATKAIKQINAYNSKGEPLKVPLGALFGKDGLTYKVIEEIALGQYKAVCEQEGINGNAPSGDILPISNIDDLGRAEIVGNPIISARDTETDESVRQRAITYIREAPFGGNKASYKLATLAIDGVGECVVFGASETGTPQKVVLIIGDEQGNKASDELIAKVQEVYNESNPQSLSPIGANVTVATSEDLPINVTAQVKLNVGESFEAIEPIIKKAVDKYIEDIAFTDKIVYYAKIITEILNSNSSIVDVQNVKINGLTQNIVLNKAWNKYQVPTVGTITISEVV